MGIKNIKYVPELDRLENSMHFFFNIYSNKKLTERNTFFLYESPRKT